MLRIEFTKGTREFLKLWASGVTRMVSWYKITSKNYLFSSVGEYWAAGTRCRTKWGTLRNSSANTFSALASRLVPGISNANTLENIDTDVNLQWLVFFTFCVEPGFDIRLPEFGVHEVQYTDLSFISPFKFPDFTFWSQYQIIISAVFFQQSHFTALLHNISQEMIWIKGLT